MNETSFKVSARIRLILLAVAATLVREPADLIIHNKEERLIHRMQLILAQFPSPQRFFMCLGILFFDRVPFLFGFGLRRFVNMGDAARQQYVKAWSHTRSTLLHELYKGIRGLVLVCYFSHTDIWNYIGYTPHAFVSDRIALRRQMTGETIPDLAPAMDEKTAGANQ